MKKIFRSAEFSVPARELWKKWTTKDGLKSFFAPECKIELEIGGSFEMYFLQGNEKGKQGSEGCKILSYLPEEMLSFSWNAPPEYPKVRKEFTWVVLQFIPINENSTLLQLTHLGWKEGKEWDNVYEYFTKAWAKVFRELERSF